eukprot:TRINITY_DN4002_c0_g1_i1.p1 TRINITY_DN4002_c0_g1~~TRINITY_DN4002_c0_g1_i1.p1  ORF type:complete len:326 (-),score=113.59 TRINITY_DN4002_c0_g1_i1:4-981(-)
MFYLSRTELRLKTLLSTISPSSLNSQKMILNLNSLNLSSKTFSTTSKLRKRNTAAALIIASEILSGKIQDSNIKTLSTMLFDQGVDLVRVEIVKDDFNDIIESLKRISPKHTYIFTSGGIGPTHDDITYEAVAIANYQMINNSQLPDNMKANDLLEVHQQTLEQMKAAFKLRNPPVEVTPARLRMATLPKGCQTYFTPSLWVPIVCLKNIYVLPGIPTLFTKMIMANKHLFFSEVQSKMHRRFVYTNLQEGDFAFELADIQKEFQDFVIIGSYPQYNEHADWITMVSIEGDCEDVVNNVTELVRGAIKGKTELEELSEPNSTQSK